MRSFTLRENGFCPVFFSLNNPLEGGLSSHSSVVVEVELFPVYAALGFTVVEITAADGH